MTISEAMRQTVKNYIDENGIGTIVTKQELFSRANEIMPIKYESFLPADYCYNRTNNGIIYTNQIHLLEILDDGNYKVLGENYPYNGGVFGNADVKGYWTDGVFSEDIPDFYYRLSDLSESLSRMLKNVTVQTESRDVIVMADDKELCRISVMDETYKISTDVTDWKGITTYLCAEANGITEYYVDRIDECIGEIKRLLEYQLKIKKAPVIITDYIDWNSGIESVLSQLLKICNKNLDGTQFHAQRNTTVGEKSIDIFNYEMSQRRVVHLWPKTRSHSMDVWVNEIIFNALKSEINLPTDIVEGTANWRGFKKIDFDKVMEILHVISKQ